jgi:acetyl-CoA carboxylase biotin carboxyl carrier protein
MADGKKPDKSGGMQVDPDLVRQLAELLDATRLTEIEVQDGERRIRVTRKVQFKAAPAAWAPVEHAVAAPAGGAPAPAPVAAAVSDDPGSHPGAVRSPMVGTAFLAPAPGARPFVTVGASVEKGDTLLIVEAMKVMNPILAPRSGRVTHIMVEDEQPVEYDQPLIVID